MDSFTPICQIDENITESADQGKCEVFISYSWKDSEIAIKLDKWLEEIGVPHFLDRNNICGGQDHKEVIIENLKKVKLVIQMGQDTLYHFLLTTATGLNGNRYGIFSDSNRNPEIFPLKN